MIYITAKKAKEYGFTHHGKCFGIPIWITDEAEPMVATKFVPFEGLMTGFQMFEGFLNETFFPEREPTFLFLIGGENQMSTQEQNAYSRGYVAGRKKGKTESLPSNDFLQHQRERVYLKSLELVLEHCHGWQISGKKINSAQGYCKLAEIFADNSIEIINQ